MNQPESLQFNELVASAREYCLTIDQVADRHDWLAAMFRILPQLHAAIVAMRDSGGGSTPPELADFDDRFDLFTQLREHLGELDLYWLEYDDPNEASMDGEHRTGSLADDLTDIYFELKRGLNMLDVAGPDAVARLWEAGFKQHWGQHLVDAERHLYSLQISNQLS
jgi:hypothetical protein